jgi:hypothetical protein
LESEGIGECQLPIANLKTFGFATPTLFSGNWRFPNRSLNHRDTEVVHRIRTRFAICRFSLSSAGAKTPKVFQLAIGSWQSAIKSPSCYHDTLSPEMNKSIKGDDMLVLKKAAALIVLAGGLLLLTACPSKTNIAKINADPDRYRGKEVGIAGTVTNSYGALGAGAYEIDDGTGRIWVATRRGVPARGSRVGAKGYVHNGFNFAGRSFGTVLEETDRRHRGN